jgi:energy-coupling factor transporter ATP-binding protein EcfA2
MPAIQTVSIEHYRGFYERRTIAFAKPSGLAGSGLTVLVGPNNSGKSSVLNAIRLALQPRQVDVEHRHGDAVLCITIVNDLGFEKGISNPGGGAATVAMGDGNAWPSVEDFRYVPSRRSWSAYTGSPTVPVSSYWTNEFNRIGGEDNLLVSRVAALAQEHRVAFDALLRELLPQLTKWKIELSRGQTFIEYETSSGAKHAADLFGDGMSSLFRIALALFDSTEASVVAIDEPELSLHPQAQKAVASAISRFAKDRQIVVTTHSPYFVNWSDISNGARISRLTQEAAGISIGSLQQKTLQDLRGLVDDWQKPNLLDAVAREVFFSDQVLFLEGQEDVGLLRKFAIDHRLTALPAFGYGTGGAGNIRYFLRMAKDLRIPAAAIFDGDQKETRDSVAQEFPDNQVELLPVADIRDKLKRDSRGKETEEIDKEGLFDRRGNIKSEYVAYLLALFDTLRKGLKSA